MTKSKDYSEKSVLDSIELNKMLLKKPVVNEFKKHNDIVMILGFAPDSLKYAPLDALNADVWGLNELYLDKAHIAIRATAWFQLHGYEPPTIRDPHQTHNLGQLGCPILMWRRHPHIHNSVQYPLHEVLRYFDIFGKDMAMDQPDLRQRVYFTNSISWMLALAIMMEYKEIHIYGVNMAQDQEFQHQRPSCEFLLGWARGKGIKIYKPPVSDLLLSPLLYGYDDASSYMQKLEARRQELMERVSGARQQRIQLQEQASQALQAEQSLLGAMHDCEYIMRIGNPNPMLDCFTLSKDDKRLMAEEAIPDVIIEDDQAIPIPVAFPDPQIKAPEELEAIVPEKILIEES